MTVTLPWRSAGSPGAVLARQPAQSTWHAMWLALTVSTWLDIMLFAVLAVALIRVTRRVIHSGRPRDPQDRFHPADRALIVSRAGNRCEQHSITGRRCEQTRGVQADHVHPHSRGGWTSVHNGQALCVRHSVMRSAAVPWGWQLRRLARRRAAYFPTSEHTEVIRRSPQVTGTPHRQVHGTARVAG